MPPKAKYTREDIIKVAFEMTRESGIESVVARKLGERLGTSSSPIFTAFKNMEELQSQVRKLAMKKFEDYVHDALNYEPAFKYIGVKMIQFAMDEPKLFQLLYLQGHETSHKYEDMLVDLGDTAEVCLELIEKTYELNRAQAELLFKQVWIQTFGICVLVSSKVCHFTREEISDMLSVAFQGTLILIKSEKMQTVEINNRK